MTGDLGQMWTPIFRPSHLQDRRRVESFCVNVYVCQNYIFLIFKFSYIFKL